MISAAVGQPYFQDDDLGFFQAVAPIISGVISAAGSVVASKLNADAITRQVQMQTQAQKDIALYRAQQESSAPTLTPTEFGIAAVVGLALILFLVKR